MGLPGSVLPEFPGTPLATRPHFVNGKQAAPPKGLALASVYEGFERVLKVRRHSADARTSL